jgi:hypothetical protein
VSVLVDALRPQVVPALYQVLRPPTDGLVLAIDSGAYTPFATAGGAIALNFQNPIEGAAYYATDAGRLASASFETMLLAQEGIEKEMGLGWSVVQLYYAAFYAAHAALRMFGCSCSFLPSSTTSRLTRVCSAVGLTLAPPLAAGLYGCSINGTDVTLTSLSSGLGGSHELFWRRFVVELNVLIPRILSGPMPTVDAQAASAALIDLRSTLVAGAAQPDWLSRLRNEVQYRHGHNLWYPNRLAARERQRLVNLIENWDLEEPVHVHPPSAGAGDLAEFVSACVFLTALCRVLVFDIAERTTRRGRSFVDYGPAKLLRQTGH